MVVNEPKTKKNFRQNFSKNKKKWLSQSAIINGSNIMETSIFKNATQPGRFGFNSTFLCDDLDISFAGFMKTTASSTTTESSKTSSTTDSSKKLDCSNSKSPESPEIIQQKPVKSSIKIIKRPPIAMKSPKIKEGFNLASNGNSTGREWMLKNKNKKGITPPPHLEYTTEYLDARVSRFEDSSLDETMYLTKYKNYKKKSWQPRSNLYNSPDLIKEFDHWANQNQNNN